MPTGGVQVLAVVPTLDPASGRLERLITALGRLEGGIPLRVLVIANRGADLPIAHATSSRPSLPDGIDVIETGLNLGFAGSIVFGASLATFTHLWLLQDDLEPDPACLVGLLSAFDADATLGAVNPTRVDARGTVLRGQAGGLLDEEGRVAAFLPRADIDLERYVPDAAPDFLMSRGMLVRATAWREVGGMDPRFYPVGWSDVDLCTRLRAADWSLRTVASATVLHAKGASTPRALGAVTYDRNGVLFRAGRAGGAPRPAVDPRISRDLLEAVAQSASSLALDLSRRTGPRSVVRLLRARFGGILRSRLLLRRSSRP